MLSKAHFEGMLECSWAHGIHMSELLANGDGTIIAYCRMYRYAEELCPTADVDEEPYFSMREFCVNKLKEYYENNA